MAPRPAPLATALLLLASLAFASPASAGAKLDLSPYLGGSGTPGDFRLFSLSIGGERTVTLLDVQPWSKGWHSVIRSVISGAGPDYDGTSTWDAYVTPGVQLFIGSQSFDDGVDYRVTKPIRTLRLLDTPGKTQRSSGRATVLFAGSTFGFAQRTGAWTTEGFEAVSTPSGDYANALRAHTSTALKIRNGPNEFLSVDEETSWYAEGRGLVRSEISLSSYTNGSLTRKGALVEELASGSAGGVPFP